MQDQSFTIDSSDEGFKVALHFEVKNGKLTAMHGVDYAGRKYSMCIKLSPAPGLDSQPDVVGFADSGALADGDDGSLDQSICCCFDPDTGQVVCTQTAGPCPSC